MAQFFQDLNLFASPMATIPTELEAKARLLPRAPWEEEERGRWCPLMSRKPGPLSEFTTCLGQALQAQKLGTEQDTERGGWRWFGALESRSKIPLAPAFLLPYPVSATQAVLGQAEVLGTRAGALGSSVFLSYIQLYELILDMSPSCQCAVGARA